MSSIGIGIGINREERVSPKTGFPIFVTFAVPLDKYVYFGKTISAHAGVYFDIDLTAQHNMVYFNRTIIGTREVGDGFLSH